VTHALILLTGSLILLVFSGIAVLLWRRFYRDDAQNTVRRVLKNSAVPFAVRLIVRVLDFAFMLVLYSTLAPEEIGPYTLAALLVAQYLITFTEFGLGILLTREVARDSSAAPRLFGITLVLRWLLVLSAVPIAALLIGVYSLLSYMGIGEAMTPVGQQVVWILLLTLIPGAYSGAVTALYNASERMEIPAIIELVTATLSLLLRVTLLLLGFGIVGLAWSAVAVSTCTAAIYFVLQRRMFFPPRLHWDISLIKDLIPLAFPLMLNNLLNVVFFRFDMFIIKAFGGGAGDTLVQQNAVAYQIINIALILPPVITFAVFPHLSRRAEGQRKLLAHAQNRTLQLLLLLALPLAMGLCVLSTEMITLLTQRNANEYLPISAHVLAILAWFLPLSFVNGLIQYVLIAINQQWVITRAFLIGAAFNLVANLVTIPIYGLYAASIITILSEIVLFAIFLPILRKEKLSPPLFLLSWRPAISALLMGGAMLLAAPVGWLLAVVVAPPVYTLSLWALGAFGPEEVALLRRVFGRTSPQ
jgi:O-antigen/teichoic acid export membrane protein